MPRYTLLVGTNPVEGQEAEYHRWYDEEHVPDVLAQPGFVAAERYESLNGGPHRFYALYTMESDDPIATFNALNEAMKSGRPPSPALQRGGTLMAVLGPIKG